jgi:hypothetical protein
MTQVLYVDLVIEELAETSPDSTACFHQATYTNVYYSDLRKLRS